MKLAIAGGASLRTDPFPEWPIRGAEEMQQFAEVFQSGTWTHGEKTREFERQFAEYHDCQYGIAVATGTVNLEIALRALGLGTGDEVIIPAYDFISVASSGVSGTAMPPSVKLRAPGRASFAGGPSSRRQYRV